MNKQRVVHYREESKGWTLCGHFITLRSDITCRKWVMREERRCEKCKKALGLIA